MDPLQAQVADFERQVQQLQETIAVLRKSEARHVQQQRLFEAILEYMPAGVFVADVPSGRPVLANRFNREQLRRPQIPNIPKEELASEYSVFIADTDRVYPVEQMPIVRAMTGVVCHVDDMELRFPEGNSLFLEVVGAPLYDANGKITNTIAITRDITDAHIAKGQLKNEKKFLRGLIQVQERDRQLLAYEIHDGLVQYLTAAVWNLEALGAKEPLPENAQQMLAKTQSLLRNAMADARRVLSGLRPPVLDEHGIIAALDYLVAENQIAGQLIVEGNYEVTFRRLHPVLENAIFRIVQESLSNVRKHSGAGNARVLLRERDDQLELTVTDDGKGFNPADVPETRFGLQGISKRAELLGGCFKIKSVSPHGTEVCVRLPKIVPDAAPIA
jgi:signal transduction histidine kinase